jgi:hypothetical protein
MAVVALNIVTTTNAVIPLLRAEKRFTAWSVAAGCLPTLERFASFFLATRGSVSTDESCRLILFLDIVSPFGERTITLGS